MLKKIQPNMALVAIPLALAVAYLLYTYLLGHPDNFVGGDPANDPVRGNYLGTIHKGGLLVVLLISFQIIMLVYVVERFLSIRYSLGKGNLIAFVQEVKALLARHDMEGILAACDRQQGAVASVVKTGISTFLHTRKAEHPDQKDIYLIQKELEEATQLELPLLNTNMFILSTIAQISTLVGLLGTVTGMIKAFASLANVGEPDAVGLASGISQALVTTALGIATAAITIVFYNYFANQIERITYTMDECSFSIVHSLKTRYYDDHGHE